MYPATGPVMTPTSGSGRANNLYPGLPPVVYTSPYHVFNIDEAPSPNGKPEGGANQAELKAPLPVAMPMSFQVPASWELFPSAYNNFCEPNLNDGGQHQLHLNSQDQEYAQQAQDFIFSSQFYSIFEPEATVGVPGAEVANGVFDPSGLEGDKDGPLPSLDSSAQSPFLPFGSQASTAHNKRMIFPYTYKKRGNPGNKSTETTTPTSVSGGVSGAAETSSSSASSSATQSMRDEPLLLYRFFEFYCNNCEQCWLSPLFRAKNGCYCRICHHFILPRGIRHSFTPYLGKETCYGKYSCHLCQRGWSSYKSLSNCPDQCFECGTLVYPYYQIAHSVLYHKINKNDDELSGSGKSAFLKSLLTSTTDKQNHSSGADHNRNLAGSGLGAGVRRRDYQGGRQRSPHNNNNGSGGAGGGCARRIISISGLRPQQQPGMLTPSKKRLHCLNNLHRHSAVQQIRRQFHLKGCFSEPTISPST